MLRSINNQLVISVSLLKKVKWNIVSMVHFTVKKPQHIFV